MPQGSQPIRWSSFIYDKDILLLKFVHLGSSIWDDCGTVSPMTLWIEFWTTENLLYLLAVDFAVASPHDIILDEI